MTEFATGQPRSPSRVVRWTAALLTFLLAAIWIASGVSKLVDPADFVRVVGHHNLVPPAVAQASWLLGVLETGIGTALVAFTAKRTLLLVLCAFAAALLLGFAYYVAHIPTEALVKVGCGCQLGLKRVADSAAQSRWWLVATDIALAGLHGLLALLPRRGPSIAPATPVTVPPVG